jgi:GTP-binding protein Era
MAAGRKKAKAKPAPVRRSGTVALVGRSNVGKSTLLNAALEMPLAIVSRKPQTTRHRLLGIVRYGEAEIGFVDTPGLHQARTKLGREMNRAARGAAREADVLVFVTAVQPSARELSPHPRDLQLLEQLPKDGPVLLVLNKIDLVRDKRQLLPLLQKWSAAHPFAAIVPVSALREDGIERVLDEVAPLLPEGEQRHGADEVTDRPVRWLTAEYVREALLDATEEEVPHAVAVTIDEFVEPEGDGVVQVSATVHVERPGQKQIVIGEKGSMLKRIGIRARQRIEELLARQVMLKLWVVVTPGWRDRIEQLVDFGLTAAGDRAAQSPESEPGDEEDGA